MEKQKQKYRVTAVYEFEVYDDIMAREVAKHTVDVLQKLNIDPFPVNHLRELATKKEFKLQKIFAGKPPEKVEF